MDPHELSQGRTMLIARGAIAFLFGVIASNQPGISSAMLLTIFGVWALAEGAATIRQAYSPTLGSAHREVRPVLLVLGGVALLAGLLVVVVPGLSTAAAVSVLAGWVAVRAGCEVMTAYAAGTTTSRVLFSLTVAADLALVAVLVTHTSGSVADVALLGGGIAAVWGVLLLVAGLTTARITALQTTGPRLLAPR